MAGIRSRYARMSSVLLLPPPPNNPPTTPNPEPHNSHVLPAPSKRTMELNKAAHGRKRREIMVFIFPLVFALVPVAVLVRFSPNPPSHHQQNPTPVNSTTRPPTYLPTQVTSPDSTDSKMEFSPEDHIPPIICFLVIPLYHIYLFAFRSRGKASLPFFGSIRVHWVRKWLGG